MSPRCVLYGFAPPYHDRYRPKCRFCSQRLQNGHFFITHFENQTVPLILMFFWETFKYCSLRMYFTRIAFVRSNLANMWEIFFRIELILLQNVWYGSGQFVRHGQFRCPPSNSLIFGLIQSYWVSKVRYCLPLVCSYSKMTPKKRSTSRLTNSITPTVFLFTGIRFWFFYSFFMKAFDFNRSNWVSTDSQRILFPLIIRTHWTHTYIYIRIYVS